MEHVTPKVREAMKIKKESHWNWKNNGRPTDPFNTYFIDKKNATQLLRKEQRFAVAEKRMTEREEIMEARTSNKKLFYKLIRKQRGNSRFIIDDLHVGDEVYHTEGQILNGWRHHFSGLAKHSDVDTFDQEYLNIVDIEYQQIIDVCKAKYKHEEVSITEIEEAIQNLNRNKAPDIHGLTAENLIYGGQILKNYLKQLIDKSFELCIIPDNQKVGSLTPVFKNKGNKNDAKNYRGITITPILSKVIETIMKFRIRPKIAVTQNKMQRGFTEKATPLYSAFIMEELRRENLDLKIETIFILLDAKSAFDVVRHANLIRKLYHLGIPEQIILLIDSLYRNAVSSVKWNGSTSDPFVIEQGVRQGGTLSADLYKIYINQLLDELCDLQIGGKIGNINCCAPTCADDITITANNVQEAQILINIASDYSYREAYHLQPLKSVVLPQNTAKTSTEEKYDLKLNNTKMSIVDKATHIGITRSVSNTAVTSAEENIKKELYLA